MKYNFNTFKFARFYFIHNFSAGFIGKLRGLEVDWPTVAFKN